MDRRECLAVIATSGMLSGCLSVPGSGGTDGKRAASEPGGDLPEPDGRCGLDDEPLSASITSSGGDSECRERPVSVTIENEREETVETTVTLTSNNATLAEKSYVLESGARVLERAVADATQMDTVSVSIENDGGEFSGSWQGVSCRRHAVALLPQEIEVGYVQPVNGEADGQHDCYYGYPRDIRVGSRYQNRDVTVSVVDHCAGETQTETVSAGPGRPATLDGALTSGGVYHIVFDVEGGGETAFEYGEACHGVQAKISAGGVPEASITPWY